jgi:hypothetical protein
MVTNCGTIHSRSFLFIFNAISNTDIRHPLLDLTWHFPILPVSRTYLLTWSVRYHSIKRMTFSRRWMYEYGRWHYTALDHSCCHVTGREYLVPDAVTFDTEVLLESAFSRFAHDGIPVIRASVCNFKFVNTQVLNWRQLLATLQSKPLVRTAKSIE